MHIAVSHPWGSSAIFQAPLPHIVRNAESFAHPPQALLQTTPCPLWEELLIQGESWLTQYSAVPGDTGLSVLNQDGWSPQ